MADHTPNWTPLEQRIGDRCAEFMWMYRQNGFEYYKHRDTRRYLILDQNGNCYRNEGRQPVLDFDAEFEAVTAAL